MYNRVILICLAIFFFVGNYHICNYFYPLDTEEHINNWWVLKMDIYALIIVICLVLANTKKTEQKRIRGLERFLGSVGVGLAISNLIDRHVYDLEGYIIGDVYTILIILFVAYIDYYKFMRITNPF